MRHFAKLGRWGDNILTMLAYKIFAGAGADIEAIDLNKADGQERSLGRLWDLFLPVAQPVTIAFKDGISGLGFVRLKGDDSLDESVEIGARHEDRVWIVGGQACFDHLIHGCNVLCLITVNRGEFSCE